MEREFIIQASTSESIDTMVKNSVTALKQDIGTGVFAREENIVAGCDRPDERCA